MVFHVVEFGGYHCYSTLLSSDIISEKYSRTVQRVHRSFSFLCQSYQFLHVFLQNDNTFSVIPRSSSEFKLQE